MSLNTSMYILIYKNINSLNGGIIGRGVFVFFMVAFCYTVFYANGPFVLLTLHFIVVVIRYSFTSTLSRYFIKNCFQMKFWKKNLTNGCFWIFRCVFQRMKKKVLSFLLLNYVSLIDVLCIFKIRFIHLQCVIFPNQYSYFCYSCRRAVTWKPPCFKLCKKVVDSSIPKWVRFTNVLSLCRTNLWSIPPNMVCTLSQITLKFFW